LLIVNKIITKCINNFNSRHASKSKKLSIDSYTNLNLGEKTRKLQTRRGLVSLALPKIIV